MKTMLALALVGFLSITSLAQEDGLVDHNQLPSKPKIVPPLVKDDTTGEFSQKSCPSGSVKIEDNDTGDFCISKDLEDKKGYDDAVNHCQTKVFPENRKFNLCSKGQLVSACSKKENFVRNPARTSMYMLGRGYYSWMGGAGCDVKDSDLIMKSQFRCCIQL